MHRFLHVLFKFFSTLFLWFLSIALVVSLIRLIMQGKTTSLGWAVTAGLVGGLFVFPKIKLLPLYVFGHELTHWAVAVLFRRKTSNIRLRLRSGSVDVDRPNIWIILAPYFIPFYMVLILGFYGLLLFCFRDLSLWTETTMAICIGVTYAYHLVLTFIAISNGQQDLKINGVVFSLSLILALNLIFVYLGLMLATRQFQSGTHILYQQLKLQALSAIDAAKWIASLISTPKQTPE
jgi:hypothetical protein